MRGLREKIDVHSQSRHDVQDDPGIQYAQREANRTSSDNPWLYGGES